MNKTLPIILIALLSGACAQGSTQDQPTVVLSQAVLERINSSTNCGVLQAEFDQAYENRNTNLKRGIAYMEAADARMKEVGCY